MQPTPPPTLAMPTLDDIVSGTTLFFSVVETYNVCPVSDVFRLNLDSSLTFWHFAIYRATSNSSMGLRLRL